MAARSRARMDEEESDPNEPEEKRRCIAQRGPVQKPLQYATLKLVLRSMEPNLRFRTSLYCPSIRKIGKSIPLKINFLKFQENGLKINETEYTLKVVQTVFLRPKPDIQLEIDGEECQEKIRITHTFKMCKASQDLSYNFFGGRNTITEVNQLRVDNHAMASQLPDGLQFKVNAVHVESFATEQFQTMLPMIHDSSYPLNHLWFDMASIDDLKHAIPQKGVKEVGIAFCFNENSIELYRNFPQNTYLKRHNFKHIDLLKYWKEDPPVVEKTLSVGYDNEEKAKLELDQLKAHDFEFCSMEDRCCTIAINNHTMVKLSVELKKKFSYKRDKEQY